MEESILTSTKKILGLDAGYTAFDLDVITHINSALSTLSQLGVGVGEFIIEDDEPTWGDLELPQDQLSVVKTYIYLKVRLLFDPPGTAFLITAAKEQIAEYEWRISQFVEEGIPLPVVNPVRPEPTPEEEVPVW